MRFINRRRRFGIYAVLLAAVLLAGCFTGIHSQAAEPKVMVTDYEVSPSAVTSGGSFTLAVTLTNTAARKVRNLKLTVISEEGHLLPDGGAGTAYINELAAGEELELRFDMIATRGLEEKAYKLTVRSEYEDASGSSYTVEDNIFIPVSLEQRLSVTDVLADDSVKLGDDVEITGMVNNLGEGTLYNVSVIVEGENIDRQTSYIGNIESGKSGSIDVVTRTNHVTETAADRADKNYMIITYEDKQGEQYEHKTDVAVYVDAVNYNNLTVLKETKEKGISGTVIAVAAVIVAAALAVILAVMKWRKKKRILEEF